MTLPFCLVALPFTIIQGTTSNVIAIPLASMTTPEDHLKKVNALKYGFSLLQESIHPMVDAKKDNTETTEMTNSKRLNKSLSDISNTISSRHFNPEDGNKKRPQHRLTKSEEWVLERANLIFNALDPEKTGHIGVVQFTAALKASGLTDPEGLHFAVLVFGLMDMDNSRSIEREEFGTLALVSRSLVEIRYKCTKFMDFVDVDGNNDVDFEEIDSALQYLGEPLLTEEDRNKLASSVGHPDLDHDEVTLNAVELINFVMVSAIQHLVQVYHRSASGGDANMIHRKPPRSGHHIPDDEENAVPESYDQEFDASGSSPQQP